MSDHDWSADPSVSAIDVFVRHLIVETYKHEGPTGWEDYPEISERDWSAIMMGINDTLADWAPSTAQVREAYQVLEERAESGKS